MRYKNLYEILGSKICAYLFVIKNKNSKTIIINSHLSLEIKLFPKVEFNDSSLITVNNTEADDNIIIVGLITDNLPVISLIRKFPIITPNARTIAILKIYEPGDIISEVVSKVIEAKSYLYFILLLITIIISSTIKGKIR
jgi:hypothetical protein